MWSIKELECVKFRSLKYLEGSEVEAKRIPVREWMPEKIIFEKDFPNGILLDLEFVETHGWRPREPRHYKLMVSKNSIACGDVVISVGGHTLNRGDVL